VVDGVDDLRNVLLLEQVDGLERVVVAHTIGAKGGEEESDVFHLVEPLVAGADSGDSARL